MQGKKLLCLAMSLVTALMLTACGQVPEQAPPETTEPGTGVFETLESLLGLRDEEAAGYFGGGEENWTADKSFLIGRIYHISLFDTPVNIYTTYLDDNTVASVSVWVTDGTRQVAEDEVNTWVERVSQYAGAEPVCDDTTSEGGSRIWKWTKDDVRMDLHWLGDVVTIEFRRSVGELK